MKEKTLREKYSEICLEYIEKFCQKQEMGFENWADENHIAQIGDYYLSMNDIIYDVDNNCPADQILHWYDDNLTAMNGDNSKPHINYHSYNLGLRILPDGTYKNVKELI